MCTVIDDGPEPVREISLNNLIGSDVTIKVPIIIVVEERGHGRLAIVCQPICFRHFFECWNAFLVHSLIDIQKIFPVLGLLLQRSANINIQQSIVIDINRSHTACPSALGFHACNGTHIHELQFAFIQIEFTGYQVAGEIKILQTVIVEVSRSYAPTIVHVLLVNDVDGVCLSDRVAEIYACIGGVQLPKYCFSGITGKQDHAHTHRQNSHVQCIYKMEYNVKKKRQRNRCPFENVRTILLLETRILLKGWCTIL